MMMESTDKLNCNIIADLLVAHNVNHVVASPGSRNAPLLVAISRRKELCQHIVIDERSAAFIALGMAIESRRPVALVCTSGSAVLNYAPAVAEAYYRGIPLIVISADRPEEWIDQDDSQTIRQPGCLSEITKFTCDIPARIPAKDDRWMAVRNINDAILTALKPHRGPVHINVRIDAPLGNLSPYAEGEVRVIKSVGVAGISDSQVSELAKKIASTEKVLIIAGFMSPNMKLEGLLNKMAKCDNVAVMTETIANVHGGKFIPAIDLTLSSMDDSALEDMRPDLVITIGGALVSRKIKEYLRASVATEHWHVGTSDHLIDCFRRLTLAVNCEAESFFEHVVNNMPPAAKCESDYRNKWQQQYRMALESHQRYLETIGWSDMKAFDLLLNGLPENVSLHFSNGTPIRYSQLFGYLPFHRTECNRGVSGIDGCTSTALGASVMNSGVTVLITGDMSAQYDLAALSCNLIHGQFKMVVINNSGGGIFRFVKSTSSIPEREELFSQCMNLPMENIAKAYGLGFYKADNAKELVEVIPDFMNHSQSAAILWIVTPPEESARILTRYFERR